jgi:hypothetical protein
LENVHPTFNLLPQHKKMIIDQAKFLYQMDITESDIDGAQAKEPFVNFNLRQAMYLMRSMVIDKTLFPILQDSKSKASPEQQTIFNASFALPYLYEALESFRHGLVVSTIALCRSTTEVSLREKIALKGSRDGNRDKLEEYKKLEFKQLGGLIEIADRSKIIAEDHFDRIFTPLHLLANDVNAKDYRKLLDKFVHGAYSDLFLVVEGIRVEDAKPKNYRELYDRIKEMNQKAGLGVDLSASTYFNLVRREEVAYWFLFGLIEFLTLMYFK